MYWEIHLGAIVLSRQPACQTVETVIDLKFTGDCQAFECWIPHVQHDNEPAFYRRSSQHVDLACTLNTCYGTSTFPIKLYQLPIAQFISRNAVHFMCNCICKHELSRLIMLSHRHIIEKYRANKLGYHQVWVDIHLYSAK